MIDLLISIVNTNHADMLHACLDSVFRSVGDLSTRVILLDNASTDGSAELVAECYPNVELIASTTRHGFGMNHNYVIEPNLSSARYYLLLNEDTVVEESSIQDIVHFMDKNPQVGIAGARLVYPDGTPQSSFAAFPTVWDEVFYLWGLGQLLPKHRRLGLKRLIVAFKQWLPKMTRVYLDNWINPPTKPVRVDWVCGACIMVRCEVIHQVGLLDAERFFIYYEETDWCKRAAEAGWETYFLPETCVRHFSSASLSHLTSLAYTTSGYRYFEKHGTKWDVFFLKANTILKALLMIIWSGLKWLVMPSARQSLLKPMALHRDLVRVSLSDRA